MGPTSTASSEVFWGGGVCRQPRHTTCATWLSQGRTDIRTACPNTSLVQSFFVVCFFFFFFFLLLFFFKWVSTVVQAVSVAFRWRLRKCERRIALCWRRDVTRVDVQAAVGGQHVLSPLYFVRVKPFNRRSVKFVCLVYIRESVQIKFLMCSYHNY